MVVKFYFIAVLQKFETLPAGQYPRETKHDQLDGSREATVIRAIRRIVTTPEVPRSIYE